MPSRPTVAHSDPERVEELTAEQVVDGNAAVDLLLAPGGSLRLVLPAGALPGGMNCRPKRALSLVLPSGFDAGFDNLNFCMNYIAAASTTDDEGAWIIRDLPPGALTVKLGEGPAHAVDIVAGQTTELDLR